MNYLGQKLHQEFISFNLSVYINQYASHALESQKNSINTINITNRILNVLCIYFILAEKIVTCVNMSGHEASRIVFVLH